MGNTLTLDFDEFYLKLSYKNTGTQPRIFTESKFVKWSLFEDEALSLVLGKLLLTDLFQNVSKDTDEQQIVKEFVDSFISEEPKDKIHYINVTGYGFDIYQEDFTKFLSKFVENFAFHKEKHIKAITHGLLHCKKVENKQFFYNFTPLDIVKLPKIDFTKLTFDKHYHDFKDYEKSFMLVNVKSGVSYYEINSEGEYTRISGSIMGESTFAGLIRILAGIENNEEALELCMSGDNTAVDMTVKDIYGGACNNLGLDENILASSMGKAQYISDKSGIKKSDICRSIVTMLCINISQLASLVAKSEKIDMVIFQGISHLAFQILFQSFFAYWSQSSIELLFVDHNEHLGNTGLHLLLNEQEIDNN